MSVLDCVRGKVKASIFREMEEEYAELLKTYKDPAIADVELLVSYENRVNSTKTADIRAAIKTQEVLEDIKGLLKAQTLEFNLKKPMAQKVDRLLAREPSFNRAAYDIYNRASNSGTREVADIMVRLNLIEENITATGLSFKANTKLFHKVHDGLIDGIESIKDSGVRAMVKQMDEVRALVLTRYKAQGGQLGHIENYTPIHHNRQKIIDAGEEAWSAAYIAMNDISKMKDFKSGKAMTPERFREIVADVYQDIITGGASRAQRALKKGGGRSRDYVPHDMFTRRMQSRLSAPHNAKAFNEYNELYGVGSAGLYDAMLSSMREMAHDVGVMKELGPMPGNLARTLEMHAVAEGATAGQVGRMRGMYRTLIGSWEGSSDALLSRATSGMQGLLSSSMLGSAPISALGDGLFIKTTTQLAGLSGYGKGTMQAYFATIAGNPNDIVRGIHAMEAMAHTNVSRYLDGDMGNFTGAVSVGINNLKNLNHRVSGLHRITLAGGDAMSLKFASALGEMIDEGLAFADLNSAFRINLLRNGLNEADWKRMLKAGSNEQGFITKNSLPEGMERIGEKIGNMELELRAWATNSPELRTRMYSTGNVFGAQQRGGLGHGLASSLMQFKSFPLQVFRNHLIPALMRAANGDVSPLATLVVAGTVMGAVIVQLKELIKGNPPLEADDPSLWFRGFVQSGVGGVLGDIMFKDPEQYKRNILGELAGPTFSYTSETIGTALILAKNVFTEDFEDIDVKPVMRAVRTAVPLTTLWYFKGGIDRLVLDGLNTMVDPSYHETIQRREARFQEERGQRSYYDQYVRKQ